MTNSNLSIFVAPHYTPLWYRVKCPRPSYDCVMVINTNVSHSSYSGFSHPGG